VVLELNYVELLREVGACFSVNAMLRASANNSAGKRPELSRSIHMIMQSYDFYQLFKEYGCVLRSGATTSGRIFFRGGAHRRTWQKRPTHDDLPSLTAEGKKMGKTQSGAVWLDPEKTSPSSFILRAERGRRITF
jgi:tyrosyl-tRNA synthetase